GIRAAAANLVPLGATLGDRGGANSKEREAGLSSGLLLPLPDHDHAHHFVVPVGVRHGRALDEQAISFEADEAGLLAADPSLVPCRLDLGDHLTVLDPVAAGIGDHGAERLRALL